MKALYIYKNSSPADSFQWRPLSKPDLKPNEVWIKTSAFGINYADIMARQGLYREAPLLPFVPGYEVVGEVIDAGIEAVNWKGKRVLAFTRFGGYATHALSQTSTLVALENNTTDHVALALATQYATAFYATQYLQPVRPHETVLIQAAAGGVGIALQQLCKLAGAHTIGLCSSQEKIDFCLAQGYDEVYNYNDPSYLQLLKQKYPKGIDVLFNSLAGTSFKTEKKLLAFGGRIILFGGAARSGMKGGLLASLKMVWQMGFIIPIGQMMTSKSLIGINMLKIADNHPHIIQYCMQKVYNLYLDKKISPYVAKVFDANEIAKAHELIESRKSMGKVVCMVDDKN
jgi:NADPH:quinone reductase-like Zn-dependent oxidoreductase